MPWVLLVVLLAWIALGPWVLVAAVVALLLPRVGWQLRERLRPTRPRRVAAIAAAGVALVTAVVVAVPDGWLPVPPSPGLLVAPEYVGRPASPDPIAGQEPPRHPHLARNGAASTHHDAWATDAYPWSGPHGLEPEVDTASFGLERCATLTVDSRGRLVGRCAGPGGERLRVLDPDSMDPLATKELPEAADGATPARQDRCRQSAYLDDEDRIVVATADRRVLAVRTSDAEGTPDLFTDQAWDLSGQVPGHDCVVALLPDWAGRIWFATGGGVVGALDPATGEVRTADLGEQVTTSFAVDERGGVFVVSDAALYRLTAGPGGVPTVTWRTAYDRGTRAKPGQPGRGSGTTPTIIDGGVVAITDNAEPRMHVVLVDRSTGVEICRAAVFGEDGGATDGSLVSVGSGVVVVNHHGHGNALSTALGRGTEGGLARVDLTGRECAVTWTSDLVAPSSVAAASWPDGLVYAWTKRPTWWGVSAWYLSAVDAATGRTRFSIRTGTGMLADDAGSAVVLAPDGSAYVATRGGLVRVRDRRMPERDEAGDSGAPGGSGSGQG